MVQQMSGRRADGRQWPPVGGTRMVSDEEARDLCHMASQQSHPIAVLVREERAETGDADDRSIETAEPRAVRQARPEPRPAAAKSEARPARAVTEKRG